MFWFWWWIDFFCSVLSRFSPLSAAFCFVFFLSAFRSLGFITLNRINLLHPFSPWAFFFFQSCLTRSKTSSQGSWCLVEEARKCRARLLWRLNLCNIEIVNKEGNFVVHAPEWSRYVENMYFTALTLSVWFHEGLYALKSSRQHS